MAEVRTNLGQGVLAADYAGGLGTVTVTPASAPRGPFPSTGVFSVEAIPDGQTAGAIYTVSTVTPSSGNQVLTLIALEFGTDVALTAGATFVEVESVRSLIALIVQESAQGGGAGFNPTTQTDVTGSRSLGTVFHNTTGGPIWVNVVGGGVTGHNFQAFADTANPPTTLVASQFVTNVFGVQLLSFVVLAGNFYSVNYDSGVGAVGLWIEWSGTGGGGGGGGTNLIATPDVQVPVMSDYAWVNQNTATAGDTTVNGLPGGIRMASQSSSGGVDVNMLVKARAFAAPYTLEVGYFPYLSAGQFCSAGIMLFNSGTGQGIGLRIGTAGNFDFGLTGTNYNSVHSESSNFGVGPSFVSPGQPIFMRMVDNGSGTFQLWVSLDWGRHFLQVGTSNFIASFDQIGLLVETAFSSNATGRATFFHVAELATTVVP